MLTATGNSDGRKVGSCLKEYAERRQEIINAFSEKAKLEGLPFDIDILADTALKCYESGHDFDSGTDTDMFNYLWRAFKLNTKREMKYARNKYRVPLPENFDLIDEEYDASIDEKYDRVASLIEDRFGEDVKNAFIRHVVDGVKYSDLEKETGMNNLHKTFEKVRKYVRSKF